MFLMMTLPRLVAAEEAELAGDYEVRWSASVAAAFHKLATREADEDVTGFFDQYRFTPDKGDAATPEIGVTDALVDVYDEEQMPILRLRLRSPTSNFGVAPPDSDHPFLNQHVLVQSGTRGIFLDVAYDRLRTEDLRRFPNPTGSALTLTDLTAPRDRFYKERTGFDGTIRIRPNETVIDSGGLLAALNGEASLRGAYQSRSGRRQRAFLLSPTNDWLSLRQNLSQDVGTIGGSLTISPRGLFTLALDLDHQRFREGASTLTDGRLGSPFPASNRAIGFVPDTDRTTGALQIRRRFGRRAELRIGIQTSLLEQASGRTPEQRSTRFGDNWLLFTSANVVGELQITRKLSANAFVKYDERRNEIDRSSPLFNPSGGTQVGEFVKKLRRVSAGSELVYAILGGNRISLGATVETVDRDLDFVDAAPAQAITPANALVADHTRMITTYVRTQLQPLRGLHLRAALNYREAPETGYVIDLDKYLFGNASASYAFSLSRPVMISLFAQ
ncbi:MAG TPA: hypothetical protein PLW10_22970, partial [Myxococcota bacterium]|nr:hypothetical protein [Myxococcota bacterium]